MLKFVKVSLAVALMAALVLVSVPATQAQQGITWTTGFQVQNLNRTSSANITVELYEQGSSTPISFDQELAAGVNVTYFPVPQVDQGFNGSAIVSGDQPIASILNILGSSGTASYSGSATGVTEGSTSVGLPLIFRNNAGYSTWFSVQNVGSAATTVNVSYTPTGVGNAGTESPVSVPAGAAVTFDQSGKTDLGDQFVGVATVTADQPLAIIVNQIGTNAGLANQLTYTGFAGGATTLSLPLIFSNNAGFVTGINIQNPSDSPAGGDATVQIEYTPNQAAGGFQPPNTSLEVAEGQGGIVLQAGEAFGENQYVGSAILTSNEPIVAVVNQINLLADNNSGTSYEGFTPETASTNVVAPLVYSNNAGFFSSIQCQNTDSSATANVQVEYSPNTVTNGFQPGNASLTVSPRANAVLLQAGGDFGSGTEAGGANQYVGSAFITSNIPVSCIINQLNPNSTGDGFLTYAGIPSSQ